MGNGAIWHYDLLLNWAKSGGVDPFEPDAVQPASIDLSLGRMIRRANQAWDTQYNEVGEPVTNGLIGVIERELKRPGEAIAVLDRFAYQFGGQWAEADDFDAYVLMPGESVLCHTAERVQIPNYASSILTLKSSLGRAAIGITHAGLGEAGFGLGNPSQWTFCLTNHGVMPFVLRAGAWVVQMIMIDMIGPGWVTYATREGESYQGQSGPTLSRG